MSQFGSVLVSCCFQFYSKCCITQVDCNCRDSGDTTGCFKIQIWLNCFLLKIEIEVIILVRNIIFNSTSIHHPLCHLCCYFCWVCCSDCGGVADQRRSTCIAIIHGACLINKTLWILQLIVVCVSPPPAVIMIDCCVWYIKICKDDERSTSKS